MKTAVVFACIAAFLLGFLGGYLLHAVLTNVRILRRGHRPEEALGK